MSADFLSGLLLFGVVLFGAVYLIKEFFWESLSGLLTRPRLPPPTQPNDRLIGSIARVVDDGTKSGTLRVRAGMETWRARPAEGSGSLPVGTEVEIRAVDGLVLEVAERAAAAEQAEA
jgi:membrane protein implicated in regulation of membrane protease activity